MSSDLDWRAVPAIVDFIRDRLAEQEHRAMPRTVVFTDDFGTARLTCTTFPRPFEACGWQIDAAGMTSDERDEIAAAHSMEHASHGQRWMLADAAAKRAMLGLCIEQMDPANRGLDAKGPDGIWISVPISRRLARRTLALLALPDASHPDYDESWRP